MSEAKPHPMMHIVKKGDTLRSVCDMYGLDPKVIYEFGTNKEIMKKMKVPEGVDIVDVELPAAIGLYLGK